MSYRNNILRKVYHQILAFFLLLLFSAITNWLLHNQLLPLLDDRLNSNPGVHQNSLATYIAIHAFSLFFGMIVYQLILLLLGETGRFTLVRVITGAIACLLPIILVFTFTFGIRYSNLQVITLLTVLATTGALIPWIKKKLAHYWSADFSAQDNKSLTQKTHISSLTYVLLLLLNPIVSWLALHLALPKLILTGNKHIGLYLQYLWLHVGIAALGLLFTLLLYHLLLLLIDRRSETMLIRMLAGTVTALLSVQLVLLLCFDINYSSLPQIIHMIIFGITGSMIPWVEKRIGQYLYGKEY